MSGGGHIIIRQAVVDTLSNPTVSGNLPDRMKLAISPILAKDPADWTVQDEMVLAHVFGWALCHIP